MVMTIASKNKIQLLLNTYDRLMKEFESINNEKITLLIKSWSISRIKYIEVLNGKVIGIRSSLLIEGLKNGLAEIPQIISVLSSEDQEKALKFYRTILKENLPNFFDAFSSEFQKIIQRNAIRNEREFHLVRLMIDQAEKNSAPEDLAVLYRLINDYEVK
jgi:hypothetical protein